MHFRIGSLVMKILKPFRMQNTTDGLLRHGIILNGVVIDTLLADYIYDATLKHSLDEIAL